MRELGRDWLCGQAKLPGTWMPKSASGLLRGFLRCFTWPSEVKKAASRLVQLTAATCTPRQVTTTPTGEPCLKTLFSSPTLSCTQGHPELL